MAQNGPKWPTMAHNGPRMTQNDPKWPKNDPKLPKYDARIYALFQQFFLTETAIPQTFSVLECMRTTTTTTMNEKKKKEWVVYYCGAFT